jgi:hypothetical protein
MKKTTINPFSKTARPERRIRITHDLAEALETQRERFRDKFGRDPGPTIPCSSTQMRINRGSTAMPS